MGIFMTATPSVIASFIKKQEEESSNEYRFEYNRKFLISTCESIIQDIEKEKEKNINEAISNELSYIISANNGWLRQLFTSLKEPEDPEYAKHKLLNQGFDSPILHSELVYSEQLHVCSNLLKQLNKLNTKTAFINKYQKDFLNL